MYSIGPGQVRIPIKQINCNKKQWKNNARCSINFRYWIKSRRSFLFLSTLFFVLIRTGHSIWRCYICSTYIRSIVCLRFAYTRQIIPRLWRSSRGIHWNGTSCQWNHFNEMRLTAIHIRIGTVCWTSFSWTATRDLKENRIIVFI